MKIKYVEAMIDEGAGNPLSVSLDPYRSFSAARDLLTEGDEVHEKIGDALDGVVESLEYEMDRIDDELMTMRDVPLVAVGSNEPLAALLRREGFVNADQVVILRLPDFNRLMERAS